MAHKFIPYEIPREPVVRPLRRTIGAGNTIAEDPVVREIYDPRHGPVALVRKHDNHWRIHPGPEGSKSEGIGEFLTLADVIKAYNADPSKYRLPK